MIIGDKDNYRYARQYLSEVVSIGELGCGYSVGSGYEDGVGIGSYSPGPIYEDGCGAGEGDGYGDGFGCGIGCGDGYRGIL